MARVGPPETPLTREEGDARGGDVVECVAGAFDEREVRPIEQTTRVVGERSRRGKRWTAVPALSLPPGSDTAASAWTRSRGSRSAPRALAGRCSGLRTTPPHSRRTISRRCSGSGCRRPGRRSKQSRMRFTRFKLHIRHGMRSSQTRCGCFGAPVRTRRVSRGSQSVWQSSYETPSALAPSMCDFR